MLQSAPLFFLLPNLLAECVSFVFELPQRLDQLGVVALEGVALW
jgi:hypothetical protein